jgi:hypothetical protein
VSPRWVIVVEYRAGDGPVAVHGPYRDVDVAEREWNRLHALDHGGDGAPTARIVRLYPGPIRLADYREGPDS